MVRVVWLALRSVWWRRGQSLVVLVVALLGVTAAATGPGYQRAVAESALQQGLRSAPARTTGVDVEVESDGATRGYAVEDQVVSAPTGAGLDRFFGPARVVLRMPDPLLLPAAHSTAVFAAILLWEQGQCGHLRWVVGRCPTGADEAALSPGAARTLGLGIGSIVPAGRLSVGSPAANRLRVVGVYEPVDVQDPFWFGESLFAPGAAATTDGVTQGPSVAPVFTSEDVLGAVDLGVVRAGIRRQLIPARVDVASAGQLKAAVTDAVVAVAGFQANVSVTAPLPDLVDSLARERAVTELLGDLVTVQLVLLAWVVLSLVVAASTAQRAGEVALARLRGLSRPRVVAFALTEPLSMVVLAAPLGVLGGWLAASGLAAGHIRAGTPVRVDTAVLTAAGIALAGSVVAAAASGSTLLRTAGVSQLRRAGRGSRRLPRGIAVDAVVVALAAAGSYLLLAGGGRLDTAQAGLLGVFAPALIGTAVGLVGIRLVPLLAAAAVTVTATRGGVGGFLAARQVTRRQGPLRVGVLLAVAVALAVFAVDAVAVGARARTERAAQQVGAATVLPVPGATARQVLTAVDRADPGGRSAMAVSELADAGAAGTGRVVAVDTTRLAAVASWGPRWSPMPVGELARRLRPAVAPSVTLRGQQLRVAVDVRTVHAQTVPVPGGTPFSVAVSARVDTASSWVDLPLGHLHPGSMVFSAGLPGCSTGCRLVGFGLKEPAGQAVAYRAVFTVTALTVDGRPPAGGAGLGVPGRWQQVLVGLPPAGADPLAQASADPAGLAVTVTSPAGSFTPSFGPADTPLLLPAVPADTVPADPYPFPGPARAVRGLGLDRADQLLTAVAGATVLPRAGRDGVLVDLATADRLADPAGRDAVNEIWLTPGAHHALLRALTAAGLHLGPPQTITAAHGVLDQQPTAQALRLYALASGVALLLAAATVVLTSYLTGRRRGYEIAALRSVGVPARTLIAAGTIEQATVLAAGLILGAAGGLLAARIALPSVPVFADPDAGPVVTYTTAWTPVLALLAAVTAALAVLAVTVSRRLVRVATADRLRETQQ